MNATLIKKYESIDQSKITEKDKKVLAQLAKLTNNFEDTDESKLKVADKILDQITKLNPDAVKKPEVVVKSVEKATQIAKNNTKTTNKKTHTSSVKKTHIPNTNKAPKTPENNVMAYAKSIRKDGEPFKDALERAQKEFNKRKEVQEEKRKTELEKLISLVRTKKELEGFANSDIQRDAERKAKRKGSRFVTKEGTTFNQYGGPYQNKLGRKYWESRDRHSDRLAPNYPQDMPLLEEGGSINQGDILKMENQLIHYKNLLRNIDKYPDYNKKNVEKIISELEIKIAEGSAVKKVPAYVKRRLEELREEIREERISTGEIAELESLKQYIDPSDVELLQWAGVPEFEEDEDNYAKGGKLTKSEVMRNMYKPSGDYFFEQKGNDLIVHLTSRDAGNSITNLMDKYDVKDNGRGYHGSSYILSRKNKLNNGGALPFMTDPNFGNFQNNGMFADGGYIHDILKKRIIWADNKNKKTGDVYLVLQHKKDKSEIVGIKKQDYTNNISDYKEWNVVYFTQKNSFELGGDIQMDLAGNMGGKFGTGEPSLLSGYTGTNYTGLVGETGAMSSGELFEAGGAMAQNQQVIDDASQSYVNYYLGEGAIDGIYANGGDLEEVAKIYVSGYPYFIKKMGDTTHFKMANSKEGVEVVMGSHIGQHRGEEYYEDVRSWLKGGKSPDGNKYDSKYYAKGGSLKDVDDNLYVSISKTKDDYWFITSKPTTKKQAEEMANLVTPMRGEVNDVKTVGQVKAHSKVIYENGGYTDGVMPNISFADGGGISNNNVGYLTLEYKVDDINSKRFCNNILEFIDRLHNLSDFNGIDADINLYNTDDKLIGIVKDVLVGNSTNFSSDKLSADDLTQDLAFGYLKHKFPYLDLSNFKPLNNNDKKYNNGGYTDGVMPNISFADGGAFDDGFMRADNNYNYRYPSKEVNVDVTDEEIDLNTHSGIKAKPAYMPSNRTPKHHENLENNFEYKEEDIDLDDNGNVRAKLTQNIVERNPAEWAEKVNPNSFEYMPNIISKKHKND